MIKSTPGRRLRSGILPATECREPRRSGSGSSSATLFSFFTPPVFSNLFSQFFSIGKKVGCTCWLSTSLNPINAGHYLNRKKRKYTPVQKTPQSPQFESPSNKKYIHRHTHIQYIYIHTVYICICTYVYIFPLFYFHLFSLFIKLYLFYSYLFTRSELELLPSHFTATVLETIHIQLMTFDNYKYKLR